jgi:hypothetical protein
MAIEHQNTSIGNATAALTSAAVQSAWRDALVNHASGAWTLEEEFDGPTAIMHWVVVKCSNSVSGAGTDFYVCIGRRVSDGQMGVMVGEVYIAAANQLSKYVPMSNGTGTILADDTYGNPTAATWTLNDTWVDNFNGNPQFQGSAHAATERIFTCVDKDYAILNANNTSFYVGAMTDLIVPKSGLVATPAIACCNLLQSVPGLFGGITRHPIPAADAPLSTYYPFALQPIAQQPYIESVAMQDQAFITGVYGFPDRYQGDRVAASEVVGLMRGSYESSYASNDPKKLGVVRAKFKGIRFTTGPKAAVAYDNIVVDSKNHVVIWATGTISMGPYINFVQPYQYDSTTQLMLVTDTGIAA